MIARTSIALALGLWFSAGQVQAVPLTSTEMLQQFNVVVSGNLNSTSHVDGRTYVGGDVKGGAYVQHAGRTPASKYAGLTVGGNVSGNVHVNGLGAVVGGNVKNATVNSGESHVGGTASNSSFNGNVYVAGAASNVNFGQKIHAASYSGINLNGKVLNATTSTMNGMLVFDLTTLDSKIFSSITSDLSFNLNGASTVIFNTNDSILNLNANFAQPHNLASSLIWNFAGASSVSVGRTFGGQVLVPNGTFSNTGGANVEGGVYAKNLNQGGEIHLQKFTGSLPAEVPEPGTLALLMAGAGMIAFTGRRRKLSGR